MSFRATIRKAHDNERGAIAMLALAGMLITFMTALILYDAGFAIRHKFKAQISADAAAYSQAAVKARVMNTIAYTNVAKRTFSGLWGMYAGMMYQFYLDVAGNVYCAASATEDWRLLYVFFHGDFRGETRRRMEAHRSEIEEECPGAVDQYLVFRREAYTDWVAFSNPVAESDLPKEGYSAIDRFYAAHSAKMYRKNMKRMDDVQTMLIDTTPKWSRVEAMVRGRASGANQIAARMSKLPTRRGTPNQMCLQNLGHLDPSIETGPELVAEIRANRRSHARRSDPESKFKSDPNLSAGLGHMGGAGCASLMRNFADGGVVDTMSPFLPTRTETQDYIHTGRETPLESYRADHFEFLNADDDLGHPEVDDYEGASCGEIVDLAPEFRGFRASWAPRIAPVAKCVAGRAGWWK